MMQSIIDGIIRIMADGLVVPIVLIAGWAMIWKVPKNARFERVARGVVAGLIALFLAKVLSLTYQEGARPFVELGVQAKAAYLNNPGFPSDHVLFVFCITFVVWASTKSKKICLTLLALSVLVALGRILALVHTPLDVLGGFACALVAVSVVYGRSFYTSRLPR